MVFGVASCLTSVVGDLDLTSARSGDSDTFGFVAEVVVVVELTDLRGRPRVRLLSDCRGCRDREFVFFSMGVFKFLDMIIDNRGLRFDHSGLRI